MGDKLPVTTRAIIMPGPATLSHAIFAHRFNQLCSGSARAPILTQASTVYAIINAAFICRIIRRDIHSFMAAPFMDVSPASR